MSSYNPLYSIGCRVIDAQGKATKRVIQLTDSDITVGPNAEFKGDVTCDGTLTCNGGLSVSNSTINFNGTNNLSGNTTISGTLTLPSNITTDNAGTTFSNSVKAANFSISNSTGTTMSSAQITARKFAVYNSSSNSYTSVIDSYANLYGQNGILAWFYFYHTDAAQHWNINHSKNITVTLNTKAGNIRYLASADWANSQGPAAALGTPFTVILAQDWNNQVRLIYYNQMSNYGSEVDDTDYERVLGLIFAAPNKYSDTVS